MIPNKNYRRWSTIVNWKTSFNFDSCDWCIFKIWINIRHKIFWDIFFSFLENAVKFSKYEKHENKNYIKTTETHGEHFLFTDLRFGTPENKKQLPRNPSLYTNIISVWSIRARRSTFKKYSLIKSWIIPGWLKKKKHQKI